MLYKINEQKDNIKISECIKMLWNLRCSSYAYGIASRVELNLAVDGINRTDSANI